MIYHWYNINDLQIFTFYLFIIWSYKYDCYSKSISEYESDFEYDF